MTFGMWSSFFIELSPEEMVQTFAQKGWRRLELSTEHAERLLKRPNPSATGEAFRKFADDNGVTFPQGHLWLTCDIATDNQDETIETLRRWLDLFVAVGIGAAVLHPGGFQLTDQGCERQKVRELNLRALNALTNHIDGTDLVICLENIPKTAPEAEDLCAIIQTVGSEQLGICLDTGHLNLTSGRQSAFIHQAGPLLKAMHLADNDGSGDQHLMPYGLGTVRWDEVFCALKEIGYTGLLNFEIPGETEWAQCPLPIRLAKLDYLKAITPLMLA